MSELPDALFVTPIRANMGLWTPPRQLRASNDLGIWMPRGADPGPPSEDELRLARARAHEGWLMARELSLYPEREWTFPVFHQRAQALCLFGLPRHQGLDCYYENLSTWEDLTFHGEVNSQLQDHDLAPELFFHIVIGLEFFDSGFYVPDGKLPLPSDSDSFRGRHTVAVYGITGDEELAFMNSWSPTWGDSGWGYVSREYFEQYVDLVAIGRVAWAGPGPNLDRAVAAGAWLSGHPQSPTLDSLISAWKTTPNPMWELEVTAGEKVQGRTVISMREPLSRCDIVERRAGDRIVARAHVVQPMNGGDDVVVEEFFVLPEVRRSGHGRALERAVVAIARERGATRIQIPLSEADASPRNRPAATAFAAECGYTWRSEERRRPNVVALAERAL